MAAEHQIQRTDRLAVAVGAMVFTDLVLSLADAVIKATIHNMPLAQFIILRSCVTLPMLVAILKWQFPGVRLVPFRPGWAILRSGLLLSSLVVYYASLPHLDFSLAAAVYYTIPLFITLFSAVWLKEAVRPRGWAGVAIGFAGVLLMLRPQANVISPYAIMPLLSAVLYALAMVLTRTKSRDENPFVLALIFNLMAIAGGIVAAWSFSAAPGDGAKAAEWVTMNALQWGLIIVLSLTMLIGSVGTAIAYQLGPASIISTWDFSYLAFASMWGVLFFAERPEAVSLLGILMIAGAGIMVVRKGGRGR